jgi:hypothetical protein
MSQNWIEVPGRVDSRGKPLIWPEGVPMPQADRVVELAVAFCRETGIVLGPKVLKEVALVIAGEQLDLAKRTGISHEQQGIHLRDGLAALGVVSDLTIPSRGNGIESDPVEIYP